MTVQRGVLVVAQSRGGWIGFSAGALAAPAIAALVAVSGILASRVDGPEELPFGASQVDEGGLSLETLGGRIEIWSRAMCGIQDFPFTGMGMNAFRRVVPVLYPLFTVDPTTDIGHAHNEFLQAALDLGIPGLIAYLAMHLTAFGMLVSTWRRRGRLPFPDSLNRALILGLGGGLAAHLIFGMIDAVALGAKPGILWWALMGLVASLYRGPALQAVHRAPMPAAHA